MKNEACGWPLLPDHATLTWEALLLDRNVSLGALFAAAAADLACSHFLLMYLTNHPCKTSCAAVRKSYLLRVPVLTFLSHLMRMVDMKDQALQLLQRYDGLLYSLITPNTCCKNMLTWQG